MLALMGMIAAVAALAGYNVAYWGAGRAQVVKGVIVVLASALALDFLVTLFLAKLDPVD